MNIFAFLFIAPLPIWSFVIKGVALYRAGNLKHKGWFIAPFLLNTLGILELYYLLVVSKKNN